VEVAVPGVLASAWSLWAYALGLIAGGTSPTELIAGATLAAASLLAVAISVHLAAGRLYGAGRAARLRTAALGERARCARLPRLRDPDAPGRIRPRAPSARASAA
jgi:hypothetical protein